MEYTTVAINPVSLQEAKAHLNIIGNADDSLVGMLLEGAVGYVEGIVGKRLNHTNVEVLYNPNDSEMLLPTLPYSSNGQCSALLPNGERLAVDWQLSQSGTSVELLEDCPSEANSIYFTYLSTVEVSKTLKLAILMALAFFYENRGEESGQKSEPLAAKYLALQERHSRL